VVCLLFQYKLYTLRMTNSGPDDEVSLASRNYSRIKTDTTKPPILHNLDADLKLSPKQESIKQGTHTRSDP
jgi:hypothetical protein